MKNTKPELPIVIFNSEDEVEEWQEKNPGNYFVTTDFRVYRKGSWIDSALWYHFDCDTVEKLDALSSYLDMAEDIFNEMPFGDILKHAERLDQAYQGALKVIKALGWKKWERK